MPNILPIICRPCMFVYLPLLAHILPTLVIGFGIVIPRSPIAGVNAYTIGFAIAVLGFIPAYLAGVQIGRRQSVCPYA
jgi:hypothetical protein